MLSIVTFHVVNNAEMLRKLQRELESVMLGSNSPPKWSELEQLPYLVRYPSLLCSYLVFHQADMQSDTFADCLYSGRFEVSHLLLDMNPESSIKKIIEW